MIQDFDFIKTLGKGGFATVYMGKCVLFDNNLKMYSAQTNNWSFVCYENGKKIISAR